MMERMEVIIMFESYEDYLEKNECRRHKKNVDTVENRILWNE